MAFVDAVVVDHPLQAARGAYYYYEAFATGDCSVEQISCHQHWREAVHRDYDDREFAALAFVHGNGVGKLEFFEHLALVGDDALIRADCHSFPLGFD